MRSVRAIRVVPAAPELEAVAARPVRDRRTRGREAAHRVLRRRKTHPVAGENPLAVPQAFLQIELTEFREVGRARIHAPAAAGDASRGRVTVDRAEAERTEQALVQEVHRLLARLLLHNRRKHVRRAAVVAIARPRIDPDGRREEALHPVRLLGTPQRIVDVGTARVHRQQVADAEHLHLQVGVGRKLLREDLADKLVEVQESVVDQESNRRRHEALRMRIELMRTVQVIWRPRPLRNHLAVSHEHERVNGIKRMRSLDPLRHRRGIHALRFWRRTRQACGKTMTDNGGNDNSNKRFEFHRFIIS